MQPGRIVHDDKHRSLRKSWKSKIARTTRLSSAIYVWNTPCELDDRNSQNENSSLTERVAKIE